MAVSTIYRFGKKENTDTPTTKYRKQTLEHRGLEIGLECWISLSGYFATLIYDQA
jgi:hypothetical protein